MLFLMFYSCLMIYWSDGPLWPTGGMQGEYCETAWWKNLLYINNLVGTDKQVNTRALGDIYLSLIMTIPSS